MSEVSDRKDIVSTFREWANFRETDFFQLDPAKTAMSADARRQFDVDLIAWSTEQIRCLTTKHEEFFACHNYSWAKRDSSYVSAFEALYQYYLLQVLAVSYELIKEHVQARGLSGHPDLQNLDHMAVRQLATGDGSAFALQHDGFNYIVVSTSLLKMVNETLMAVWELAKIGSRVIEAKKMIIVPSDLGEREIEVALTNEFDQCRPHLERLFRVFEGYLKPSPNGIGVEDKYFADLLRDGPSERAKFYQSLFHCVDMFIVLHECTHLMHRDISHPERTMMEEVQTDWDAMRLFAIHARRHPLPSKGVLWGPALLFLTFRIQSMIRIIVQGVSGKDTSSAMAQNDEVEGRTALLEEIRVNTALESWGEGDYESVVHALIPVSAGMKQYISDLRGQKSDIQATIDRDRQKFDSGRKLARSLVPVLWSGGDVTASLRKLAGAQQGLDDRPR